MGTGSVLCRKCLKGRYEWSEPEPYGDDWSNKKMKCVQCGFEETLAECAERKEIK